MGREGIDIIVLLDWSIAAACAFCREVCCWRTVATEMFGNSEVYQNRLEFTIATMAEHNVARLYVEVQHMACMEHTDSRCYCKYRFDSLLLRHWSMFFNIASKVATVDVFHGIVGRAQSFESIVYSDNVGRVAPEYAKTPRLFDKVRTACFKIFVYGRSVLYSNAVSATPAAFKKKLFDYYAVSKVIVGKICYAESAGAECAHYGISASRADYDSPRL